VWMFTCMVFVFGALVEYSIVNVLARRYLLRQQKSAKKYKKELNVDVTSETVHYTNGDVTARNEEEQQPEDDKARDLTASRNLDSKNRRCLYVKLIL